MACSTRGGAALGVAIGERSSTWLQVDHGLDGGAVRRAAWNRVMAAGPEVWAPLRARLTELLSDGSQGRGRAASGGDVGCKLLVPFAVAEYTDFYASQHHATNVGTMFRGPENAAAAELAVDPDRL